MNIKKLIVWLLGSLFVFVGLYFVAEWQMNKAISEFLERKLPSHIQYSYDRLEISLIHGDLDFKNLLVNSVGRQTSSCEILLRSENIGISGLSYWKFFLKDEIHAKEIHLSLPNLNFKTCPNDTSNVTKTNKPINLLKSISVDEIVLEQGHVEIWDSQATNRLLKVGTINFSMKDVITDSV